MEWPLSSGMSWLLHSSGSWFKDIFQRGGLQLNLCYRVKQYGAEVSLLIPGEGL